MPDHGKISISNDGSRMVVPDSDWTMNSFLTVKQAMTDIGNMDLTYYLNQQDSSSKIKR